MADINEDEPTQVVQIRDWVNGETLVDHDTFGFGKEYAKEIIKYIDMLQDFRRSNARN